MLDFLKINELDNVEVALRGTETIPAGHKKAIKPIKKGDKVVKYGNPIGVATEDISEGEWVHTHNVKTGLGDLLEYAYEPEFGEVAIETPATFMGYKRPNGKVGIRNEVWVIPTVGCVNDIVKIIVNKAQDMVKGSVEGIHTFTHPYGCSQLGEDHENTKKALAGLVNHPNAGAVLVLGLGCENNHIEGFKEAIGEYDENRVKFVIAQDYEDEVEKSLEVLAELVDYAAGFTREEVPASELVIGLKCGGSDGFSGITANPLVGAISDKLIRQGGTSILTEVPEMFGAETLLMKRCIDEETFNKTVSLINNFKSYFIKHDQVVYENPSPGNKKGGITTLEDKSLGCTQKGGSAPVVDVLTYGQPVCTKGLNLLQAPGNDLVASSSLAISGAHMVLFTTGRGTPFGAAVPTVKISSNNELYAKKKNWIDFNAGQLLVGRTMEEVSNDFYNYILDLASGRIQSKTEEHGIRDLAIFKDGVTL